MDTDAPDEALNPVRAWYLDRLLTLPVAAFDEPDPQRLLAAITGTIQTSVHDRWIADGSLHFSAGWVAILHTPHGLLPAVFNPFESGDGNIEYATSDWDDLARWQRLHLLDPDLLGWPCAPAPDITTLLEHVATALLREFYQDDCDSPIGAIDFRDDIASDSLLPWVAHACVHHAISLGEADAAWTVLALANPRAAELLRLVLTATTALGNNEPHHDEGERVLLAAAERHGLPYRNGKQLEDANLLPKLLCTPYEQWPTAAEAIVEDELLCHPDAENMSGRAVTVTS